MLENLSRHNQDNNSINHPGEKSSSKKFDLVRKVVGPTILSISALTGNVLAQDLPRGLDNTSEVSKQAEILRDAAEKEKRRASLLFTQQGLLLIVAKKTEEAKKALTKALELDDTNNIAREYLDLLNKGAI